MTIELTGGFQSLILRFFHTPGGELRCRVTDVQSNDVWVVGNALALRRLIVETRSPSTVQAAPVQER